MMNPMSQSGNDLLDHENMILVLCYMSNPDSPATESLADHWGVTPFACQAVSACNLEMPQIVGCPLRSLFLCMAPELQLDCAMIFARRCVVNSCKQNHGAPVAQNKLSGLDA